MTTVHLIPRHIFGLKVDVHSNVSFVDDQTVAYPAGHYIIVCTLKTKCQKFIAGTEASDGVTATALSPSRRFLAVAERCERALVSIFDLKTLKKRKVFQSAEALAQSFVSVAFSSDNQLLLTQGGSPDWILTCWNWSTGKLVASLQVPLPVMAPSASLSSDQSLLLERSENGALLKTRPSLNANAMARNSLPTVATSLLYQVLACSFSNGDSQLVCVTGVALIRFFRVLETSFDPLPANPRMETHDFLAHAWLTQQDAYLVAGSTLGDLLLFHKGDFVTRLKASPGPGNAVHSLTATTQGLLCGLSNTTVAMLGRCSSATNDQKEATPASTVAHNDSTLIGAIELDEILTLQRLVQVDTGSGFITTIAVSPNEETIVVTTSHAQLVTFPYQPYPATETFRAFATKSLVDESAARLNASPADASSVDVVPLSRVSLPSEDVDFVMTSFHQPSDALADTKATGGCSKGLLHVTGMAVCVHKPLLVTCGLDRTVRVWNYIDRTCDVVKRFNEEAFSVACHPSGLHLLVGFADKLRLMNVLMDDLRAVKDFSVKACRECQFSTGGHLFGAVHGTLIQVFSLWTGDVVATLRGHNGKVRSLEWNADDSRLVSAGLDGAVYLWDLDRAKREVEFVQKGVAYYAALCNREDTAMYAVGGDGFLKEIELPSSQLSQEVKCPAPLGQLVLLRSQRVLLGAGAEAGRPGAIRAFKLPLTGESLEFPCLSAPVTRLRLAFDDHFLFATGEDGAVIMFEIRETECRRRGKTHDLSLATPAVDGGMARGLAYSPPENTKRDRGCMASFTAEVLVTKQDIEEKKTLMLDLKSKVEELRLHKDYQLRLKEMTYHEDLKDLTENSIHAIELEKSKYEILREDKTDVEMEFQDKIKQLEEHHVKHMQETEAKWQQEMITVGEQYQHVRTQREADYQLGIREQKHLVATHDKDVATVTKAFEARLSEDHRLRIQLEDEREELDRVYRETVAQMEADVDEEVEGLKKRYKDKLQGEREATLRFKGETGIMVKKFSALHKTIEDQRDQINGLLELETELMDAIKQFENDLQARKREIRARDETIGEKEKRIYTLKVKNQELEKVKFVLDCTILELKQTIEPRERAIANMKVQMQEMAMEAELFHTSNAQLDALIGEQQQRIHSLQKAIASHRQARSEQQTVLQRFPCDLYECVRQVQSPKELALQMAHVYSKYVGTNNEPGSASVRGTVDSDSQLEYAQQIQALETSVHALKLQCAAQAQKHQRDSGRATSENMLLMQEINELRQTHLTTNSNLQTAQAMLTAASLVSSSRIPKNLDTTQSLIAGLEVAGGDPNVLVANQASEIQELCRAIKALEDKVANDGRHGTRSEDLLPPIGQAVDG